MTILNYYLNPPATSQKHIPFEMGTRVELTPEVREELIHYHLLNQTNPQANSVWMKMGANILNGQKWYSLIYISDEQSAYPLGTAVIEIDVNEDIEVNTDCLVPLHISSKSRF